MTLWYISFADKLGFRGATVVKSASANGALATATARGLNPGGEAWIIPVPQDADADPGVLAMYNHLLSAQECAAIGGKPLAECPSVMQERFQAAVHRVRAQDNVKS